MMKRGDSAGPDSARTHMSAHAKLMAAKARAKLRPQIPAREGRWSHGVFLRWLTAPISKRATEEFVAVFKSVYDFEGPYAMLIARQLPTVPLGVNPKHPAVVNIVNQIIPHAGPLLAVDTVMKAEAELKTVAVPLQRACQELDAAAYDLERLERELVEQAESLLHAKASFVQANTAFNEAYENVINYWRTEHPGKAEKYHRLVKEIKNFPPSDWAEVCHPTACCVALQCWYWNWCWEIHMYVWLILVVSPPAVVGSVPWDSFEERAEPDGCFV